MEYGVLRVEFRKCRPGETRCLSIKRWFSECCECEVRVIKYSELRIWVSYARLLKYSVLGSLYRVHSTCLKIG